jgi:hypothetical protein
LAKFHQNIQHFMVLKNLFNIFWQLFIYLFFLKIFPFSHMKICPYENDYGQMWPFWGPGNPDFNKHYWSFK